ncbi:hypothetical protein O71_08922 [Pontibacter sp. BAB1700]|nr:hypothetical protein O71_08922 [Pontibacter sp. BAB1700]
MSAGVAAGLVRNTINSSELEFTNPAEPLIGGGQVNQNVLDLSLGLWVYSRNFSVGLAGLSCWRMRALSAPLRITMCHLTCSAITS